MDVKFINQFDYQADALVVGVFAGRKLSVIAQDLDAKLDGNITRAIQTSPFNGKFGKLIDLVAPVGLDVNRVVLVGLGEEDKLSPRKLQEIGGIVYAHLSTTSDQTAEINFSSLVVPSMTNAEIAAHVAHGAELRSWKFDKYQTQQKNEEMLSLQSIYMISSQTDESEELYQELRAVASGVATTKMLVSEPPNVLYPEAYAEIVSDLKKYGLEVEVMNEKQLRKLGMNALLGVGQGSDRESFVVILKWNGADDPDEAPISFVGKGVCFDTGGISLKPASGMDEMKYDMAGSAVVVGLMQALAMRKAKVNAIGAIGLVENMPGSRAQRPSDIVTSMSGQTIEVLNTDAEGRLVLADVLWYVQDQYKPKFMIDLATLTGAIVVCLSDQYAGMFSNSDDLAAQLGKAADVVGERVWRMPLCKAYEDAIKSDVADILNTSKIKGAGASTAAHFLKKFVNNVPWVHLDIAGVSWSKKNKFCHEKGATGFGVRLLNQLVKDNYETLDKVE